MKEVIQMTPVQVKAVQVITEKRKEGNEEGKI